MRLIDADELKEAFKSTEDANYSQWTLYGVLSEIDDVPTIDAIPREILKNIVYSYKMLDKRFEDLTPFENSIISLICPIDIQHWKLWAGEYDNE